MKVYRPSYTSQNKDPQPSKLHRDNRKDNTEDEAYNALYTIINEFKARSADSRSAQFSGNKKNSFAVSGEIPGTDIPVVTVESVGRLAYPLCAEQARALLANSTRNPFGAATKCIADPEVNQVWQIDADHVELRASWLNTTLPSIVAKCSADLGYECRTIEATLNKLILYEVGDFSIHFKRHDDSDIALQSRYLGTLLIQLPAEFEGGDIVVEGGDIMHRCSWAKDSADSCSFIAFSKDFEYVSEPLDGGRKLMLAFDLLVPPSCGGDKNTSACEGEHTDTGEKLIRKRVIELLDYWKTNLSAPAAEYPWDRSGLIALPLTNTDCEEASFETLHGADKKLVDCLLSIKDAEGKCPITLCISVIMNVTDMVFLDEDSSEDEEDIDANWANIDDLVITSTRLTCRSGYDMIYNADVTSGWKNDVRESLNRYMNWKIVDPARSYHNIHRYKERPILLLWSSHKKETLCPANEANALQWLRRADELYEGIENIAMFEAYQRAIDLCGCKKVSRYVGRAIQVALYNTEQQMGFAAQLIKSVLIPLVEQHSLSTTGTEIEKLDIHTYDADTSCVSAAANGDGEHDDSDGSSSSSVDNDEEEEEEEEEDDSSQVIEFDTWEDIKSFVSYSLNRFAVDIWLWRCPVEQLAIFAEVLLQYHDHIFHLKDAFDRFCEGARNYCLPTTCNSLIKHLSKFNDQSVKYSTPLEQLKQILMLKVLSWEAKLYCDTTECAVRSIWKNGNLSKKCLKERAGDYLAGLAQWLVSSNDLKSLQFLQEAVQTHEDAPYLRNFVLEFFKKSEIARVLQQADDCLGLRRALSNWGLHHVNELQKALEQIEFSWCLDNILYDGHGDKIREFMRGPEERYVLRGFRNAPSAKESALYLESDVCTVRVTGKGKDACVEIQKNVDFFENALQSKRRELEELLEEWRVILFENTSTTGCVAIIATGTPTPTASATASIDAVQSHQFIDLTNEKYDNGDNDSDGNNSHDESFTSIDPSHAYNTESEKCFINTTAATKSTTVRGVLASTDASSTSTSSSTGLRTGTGSDAASAAKRRGRPKGAKNKPKNEHQQQQKQQKEQQIPSELHITPVELFDAAGATSTSFCSTSPSASISIAKEVPRNSNERGDHPPKQKRIKKQPNEQFEATAATENLCLQSRQLVDLSVENCSSDNSSNSNDTNDDSADDSRAVINSLCVSSAELDDRFTTHTISVAGISRKSAAATTTNTATTAATTSDTDTACASTSVSADFASAKRRGRPKGAKNKPKNEHQQKQQQQQQHAPRALITPVGSPSTGNGVGTTATSGSGSSPFELAHTHTHTTNSNNNNSGIARRTGNTTTTTKTMSEERLVDCFSGNSCSASTACNIVGDETPAKAASSAVTYTGLATSAGTGTVATTSSSSEWGVGGPAAEGAMNKPKAAVAEEDGYMKKKPLHENDEQHVSAAAAAAPSTILVVNNKEGAGTTGTVGSEKIVPSSQYIDLCGDDPNSSICCSDSATSTSTSTTASASGLAVNDSNTTTTAVAVAAAVVVIEGVQRRGAGRPTGSKNKPKEKGNNSTTKAQKQVKGSVVVGPSALGDNNNNNKDLSELTEACRALLNK